MTTGYLISSSVREQLSRVILKPFLGSWVPLILQVEIDFDNDNNYKVTSFERFWSVPYAFVSKNDESTNMDSALQALNDKITYLKNRDLDTVIGNEGITYKTIDS